MLPKFAFPLLAALALPVLAVASFEAFAEVGNYSDIDSRTAKLSGVGSLRINDDDSVTIGESRQSAVHNTFDLYTAKHGKVKTLTVKEGEEFITSDRYFKFFYRLDKVEKGKATFSVERKHTKLGDDRWGKMDDTFKRTVEPYGSDSANGVNSSGASYNK